jgi:hypothetical protein
MIFDEIMRFLKDHENPNGKKVLMRHWVRYDMNHFVICAGSHIPELSDKARRVAKSIGKVSVDMGGICFFLKSTCFV